MKQMNSGVPALWAVSILAGAAAAGLVSGLDAAPSGDESAAISALVREGDTPGVQYIHNGPAGRYHFEAGFQEIASAAPVNAHTTFMAFSVTKTFTALAILQLAGSGKISLEDPISRYVEGLPKKDSPTIRQTLNHAAGFPNPIPLSWSHLEAEHGSFDRRAFFQKIVSENTELKSAPGEKFAYSNVGYVLLGEVIEKVSGEPYEQYVENNILNRLKLEDGEVLSFRLPQTGHAVGYLKRWSLLNLALGWLVDRDRFLGGRHESWNYFRRYYVNGPAYGGLVGNARGFSRYLGALLDPSGPFSAEFKQIVSAPADPAFPVWMGWYRDTLSGHTYFAHAGGGGGFYCEIRFYPDSRRSSVIMLNRTGVSDERILDKIDAPRFAQQASFK